FTIIRANLFQPVYTFGKISSSERAAEKGVEATMATIRDGQADTVEKATMSYYRLQFAYTLNSLVIKEQQTLEKTSAGVEELVEGGSPKATQTDKLNLKILLSNVNTSVVSSTKEVQLSRAILKRMLGIENENDFDIESHILEPVAFETNSLRFYKETSLNENPLIMATEANLGAKKFLVKKAESEYYPTIFLGGTLRYNQSIFFDDTLIAGAGLGISQVLNFSISAEISEAKAQYLKSIKEKDIMLDEIDADIEKSYLDMIENRNNIENEKVGFEAAKTLLRNATSNYTLGIGGISDLINAYSAFFKEGREYYESVYLYNLSVAHLKRAAGN
ncbi:MAG: TolC family protein, partial [Candidatus Dadabacteria bacterium]|nr:TolC family protein [Candidatus Dadabacteria bacterium]